MFLVVLFLNFVFMKKVYFLAAAAAAALSVASCATSEVVDSELAAADATPIGFSTFLDRVSRGAAAASPKASVLTTDNIKDAGFTVLAYYTGEDNWTTYVSSAPADPNFMDDQAVTWNGTSTAWEYSPPKYWPRKDNNNWEKLTFFAHSTATGASADGASNSNPVITFTTQETAAAQVDLLAAVLPNVTKASNDGKVEFAFNHILSKIGFSIRLAESYGTATAVKVKSLQLHYTADKVEKNGTYTFDSNNTVNTTDWTLLNTGFLPSSADGSGDQLFLDATGVLLNNDATPTSFNLCEHSTTHTYLMLIPQTLADDDLYVELEYDVITTAGGGGGGTSTSSPKLKVYLPGVTLEAGKEYTYNLVVNLSGVTFDPPTVNGWTTGSTQPGETPVNPV